MAGNDKFLDIPGLAYYDTKQKERLSKKADLTSVPTKLSQLTNDANFITESQVPEGAVASSSTPLMDGTAATGTENAFARGDHRHPTDTSRLSTSGDASQVTASFNVATNRTLPDSGDTLAVIVGKVVKHLSDLGIIAFKNQISRAELDNSILASLAKADTALQSYTETDPTVPSWAKETTKPSYTAAEVGAIPVSEADTFAKKSEISTVYKYKGTVATVDDLPATDNKVGDVWNVEESDMNYGWTGTDWDPLGQPFQIESITTAEIDVILSA